MSSLPPLNLLVSADNSEAPDRLLSLLRQAGHDLRLRAIDDRDALTDALHESDLVIVYGTPPTSSLPTVDSVLDCMSRQQLHRPLLYSPSPEDRRDRDTLLAAGVDDVIPAGSPEQAQRCVSRHIDSIRQQQTLRHLHGRIRELEADNAELVASSLEPIAYITGETHLQCNTAYRRYCGLSDSSLTGIPVLDLVHEADREALRALLNPLPQTPVSASFRLKPGPMREERPDEPLSTLFRFQPAALAGQPCLQLKLSEAAANPAHAERLRHLQERDLITHLETNAVFSRKLETAIRLARHEAQQRTLLKITLSDLQVDDPSQDHHTVNRTLRDIAQLLRESVQRPFSLARLDETTFGLILDQHSLAETRELADFIRSSIHSQFASAGPHGSALSCHLGMACINRHALDAPTLLAQAEQPLPAVGLVDGDQQSDDEPSLLFRIRQALELDQLRLLFQPIVSITGDESFRAYEVFTRLVDEHGNDIPPGRFLPALNLQNLGEALDQHVIRQLLDRLDRTPEASASLALNLTTTSLLSGTLPDWLSEQLAFRQLDPSRLIAVYSEIDLHQYPERVLAMAARLGTLGVRASLKHFGYALDTYRYLDELQPCFVSLDSRLIRDLAYNDQHRDNIRNMLLHLHERRLLVAAPNIEDMDLLPLLWETGFDLAQGYCLRRPSQDMDYDFIEEQEITLDTNPGQ